MSASRNQNRISRSLIIASFAPHVVWLIAFSFLFMGSPPDKPLPCKLLGIGCQRSADAVEVAASMGRLDLVAIALAVLGAVIVLCALGGYFLVREAARAAASEDLASIAPDLVKKLNLADMLLRDDRFEGTLRSIVAGELARAPGEGIAGDVAGVDADAIARKVDGKEGNGDGEFQRDRFSALGTPGQH